MRTARTLLLAALLAALAAPAPAQTVSFSLPDTTIAAGETANVPVRVDGFDDVSTVQFTVSWDPAVASFDGLDDLTLNGLSESNFGTPGGGLDPGTATVSWNDPDGGTESLGDGAVLFTLRLSANGEAGAETALSFADDPTPRQVTVGTDLTIATFDGSGGALAVEAPNASPEAEGDSYDVREGRTLEQPAPGVLGNDSDPDGDGLTASVVEEPTDGSLTLEENGGFSYTPDRGFSGSDRFRYEARDGRGGADTAAVEVAVRPANDAPAPPTALTAQEEGGQVRLSWTAPDAGDLTRYRVYRSAAPIDSSAGPAGLAPLDSVGAGETAFLDASVEDGTAYSYRVTAVDSAGAESSFSNQASAVTGGVNLRRGLAAYYPFTGSAADSSGNGIGASVNGPTLTADRFGTPERAYRFDGGGEDIQTESASALAIDTSFTVAAWIKPGFEDRRFLAVQGTVFDTDGNWEIAIHNDSLQLEWNNAAFFDYDYGAKADASISQGTWQHVAVVFASGAVRFYTDGRLMASRDFGTSSFNTTNDGLKIGEKEYEPGENDFIGKIDQFRYYSRSLSGEEVQALVNRRGFGARPPEALAAAAGTESVALTWSPSPTDSLEGYNVYRDSSSFGAPGEATQINTAPVADTSFTDTGLTAGTEYHYRVTAVTQGGDESGLSEEAVATPSEAALAREVTLTEGWNLASVPLEAQDPTFGSVLPACRSGFRFRSRTGYRPIAEGDSLGAGQGGFFKCSAATDTVRGTRPPAQTVEVEAGWNVVGAFADTTGAGSIASEPAGIVASPFFGFAPTEGYREAPALAPTEGYWVKAAEAGTLVYGGGASSPSSGASDAAAPVATRTTDPARPGLKLTVRGRSGRAASVRLVEGMTEAEADRAALPPKPPSGLFDVRFGAGTDALPLETSEAGAEASAESGRRYVLEVQGAGGPAVIERSALGGPTAGSSAEGATSGPDQSGTAQSGSGRQVVTLVDAATGGSAFEARLTAEAPSATVPAGVGRLAVRVTGLPSEVRLAPTRPNPARLRATIEYAVPEAREVRLEVYDVLGRRVATLAQGRKQAGVHRATLDAERLASGTYFYRLTAGEATQTRRLTVIK
jgi:fibronectin type 3 domain-containing protein